MSDELQTNPQHCNTTEQRIIITHLHPLSEKVAVLENTLEHQQKMTEEKFNAMEQRVGRIEEILDDLFRLVQEVGSQGRKTWWLLVGTVSTVIVTASFIKFIIPILDKFN